MRNIIISILLFMLVALPVQAADKPFIIDNIPMQNEGRVKPISTFAEIMLITISGKKRVENLSAEQWFTEVLFDDDKAFQRKIFNIPNPEITHMLGLKYDQKHRYNFLELLKAFATEMELVTKLQNMDRAKLNGTQSQLLDIYTKLMLYFEVSRSLSLIKPEIEVKGSLIATTLGVEYGAKLNYLDMMLLKPKFIEMMDKLDDYPKETQELLIEMLTKLEALSRDKNAKIFRVIPPQGANNPNEWQSFWQVMHMGEGSPETAKLTSLWQGLMSSYQNQDKDKWFYNYNQILEISAKHTDDQKHNFETLYNKINAFKIATALYLLGFVLIGVYSLFSKAILSRLISISLISGFVMHLFGLISRMYIMGRPPVTTLYESILFVGLIAVLFCLILEARNKNGIGNLLASISGAFFLFLSIKYAGESDTMGMLVAVLNTNFWLATHVVTITIGYGSAFVAGLLAHVYLIQKSFKPNDKENHNLMFNNMIGISLIALFFSVLGTILGGIWADQSWGRFWGWDPKENGAMFICLWLIWLLHGKLAGKLKPVPFAYGMVVTNIVVVLAWFGVNLLGVGLHSYGFIDKVATNISLFVGTELSFIVFIWIKNRLRNRNEA
jgi:ABC-type transport system involved in cytochrome c biogenesis permease subunit